MPEAIDAAVDRLRGKVERVTDQHHHRPVGVAPEPGTWRHGNLPSPRSSHYQRPVEERELVRHKTYAPDRLSLDEALWDLALLDFDFFLFTETSTGISCVVQRTAGDEVVLHGLADRPADQAALARPSLTFSDRPVPVLRTSEAIELLETSGEPFELYENAWTGCRNVVYHRYDGHYGLITPASDEPPSEERLVHEGHS
jgi:hypothetical protein